MKKHPTKKHPTDSKLSKENQSDAFAASKKRSFWVSILRKAVPLSVAFIVLLVLMWTSIDIFFEEKIEGLTDLKPHLEFHNKVMNPKLQTTDKDGQPVTIKAKTGVHSKDSQAVLEKPCCELERSDGKKISLSADTGVLDQNQKVFVYRGNVVVATKTKNGEAIELKTKSAKILIDQQDVEGQDVVEGTTPMGTLTAKHGFRFEKKQHTLSFKGPVEMTIKPKQSSRNVPKQASKPRSGDDR